MGNHEMKKAETSDVPTRARPSVGMDASQHPAVHLVGEERLDKQEQGAFVPRTGDIFENPDSGNQIEIVSVEKNREGIMVLYTERTPGGIKHDGRVMRKPLENFRVLVRFEAMQPVDHLKGQYPEFYALYEGEMEKTADAFLRELEACRDALEKYANDIQIGMLSRDANANEEKNREEEKRVAEYSALHDKIEALGTAWNALDFRFVRNGRQRMRLLLELRSLAEALPEEIARRRGEALTRLKQEFGSGDPDVEAVEQGYFHILLDKKTKHLQALYDAARHGDMSFLGNPAHLSGFLKKMRQLLTAVNQYPSSGDLKKTLNELSVLESQTFARGSDDTETRRKRRKKQAGEKPKVKKMRKNAEDNPPAKEASRKTQGTAVPPIVSDQVLTDESLGQAPVPEVSLQPEVMEGETSPASLSSETTPPQPETPPAVENSKNSKNKNQEKKSKERQEHTAFRRIVRSLKENQVFRKEQRPMLIIRNMSDYTIRIEYRNDPSETQWREDTIKPTSAGKFLEYMREHFGWAPENRKPVREQRDKKQTQGEKTGEETAHGAAEQSARKEERSYEALEKVLDRIELDAFAGVIAKGLTAALEYTRTNKCTKEEVIRLLGGVEKVVSTLAQAVHRALPAEWTEQEKKTFASHFAESRVELFIQEK